MARRFVDLSIYLETEVISDPPGMQPEITYIDHETGVKGMVASFPGLTAEELPDAEGWAVETIKLSTHNGTHLDAPYHFASTMNGGERAITIDEVPLEWCFNDGVKLDFRDKPNGYVVTADDVEAELARIEYTLKPLDIVVVNTAAGKRYGQDDYVSYGCGMGHDATMYLLERGVRSPVSMVGAGMLHSNTRESDTRPPVMPASFGRVTKPGVKSATATSKKCTTSRRCHRTVS